MSKKKMKRITIKIGTKVLTGKNNKLDQKVIRNLADQISGLKDEGLEVIVVSSGAIGAGLGLLKLKKKGRSLAELQAVASVGQNHLMDVYNEYLNKRGYVAGQILLTQDDFNDRRRFLNIRYTLNELLKLNAVPVINENDSISTEEIKCGDNDRLSSLVADLADSDMLIILTDVEGLLEGSGKDEKLIKKVKDATRVIGVLKELCRGKGSDESTGGMITKLEAAKNAATSGIECVIAHGRTANIIRDVAGGKEAGTHFEAAKRTMKARKRWIAFSLKPKGSIRIDEGAEKALVGKNKSLLSSGILEVSGKFADGDVVEIISHRRKVIARGLSNYSSEEIEKIKGKKSESIEGILGYKDYDEVVHRDNLVVLD